jgi:uncharacterized peroxidase-related enzyme
VYCTSVHARLASQLSKREDDIARLLRRGVAPGTPLELDDRWQAIVDAAVGLAQTPPVPTPQHVARLREVGLDDLEILDVLQAGAFFAWANRLMLTLGEPSFGETGPSQRPALRLAARSDALAAQRGEHLGGDELERAQRQLG